MNVIRMWRTFIPSKKTVLGRLNLREGRNRQMKLKMERRRRKRSIKKVEGFVNQLPLQPL
jgi:hypothetical protein